VPSVIKELISTTKKAVTDSQKLLDQKTRNLQDFVSATAQHITGIDHSANEIQKTTDNTIILATGEHPGLIVTTSTVIVGTSGTKIKASIALTGGERTDSLHVDTDNIVVHVSNLHFLGTLRIGIGPSGVIASAPTVIFYNCIFNATVFNDGKVHYIGCEFRDSVNATVNTSGVTQNFAVCCSRKGGPHLGAINVVGASETT
jgi:hypothetical protein